MQCEWNRNDYLMLIFCSAEMEDGYACHFCMSQDKNTTVVFSGRCFYFAVMLYILVEWHLCEPECNVNEKLDFPKKNHKA